MVDFSTLLTSVNIGIATVVFMIITFILLLVVKFNTNQDVSLETLVSRSLTASAIPYGLAIVICAFDLTLLTPLAGFFQVYIGMAGIVLIYISINAVIRPF
jgi:hypothetical protein